MAKGRIREPYCLPDGTLLAQAKREHPLMVVRVGSHPVDSGEFQIVLLKRLNQIDCEIAALRRELAERGLAKEEKTIDPEVLKRVSDYLSSQRSTPDISASLFPRKGKFVGVVRHTTASASRRSRSPRSTKSR
jgi:hypothetical protein